MEVSGQLQAPAALFLGKEPSVTHWIGGWVGWAHDVLGQWVTEACVEIKTNSCDRRWILLTCC